VTDVPRTGDPSGSSPPPPGAEPDRVPHPHASVDQVVDAVMPRAGQLRAVPDERSDSLASLGLQLYRMAAVQSAVPMLVVSVEGRVAAANDAACALLGRSEAELQSMSLAEVSHPDDVEAGRAALADVLTGDVGHYRATRRYLRPDGSVVHVDASVTLLHDDEGRPVGFFAVAVDETERLVAERRAAEADELLRASMNSLLDPWVFLRPVRDDGGRIVDFVYLEANIAACEHNGLTHDELVGRRLLDLLPGHAGELLEMYAQVIETGVPLAIDDHPFVSPDGSPGWFDNRAVKVGDDGLSFTWKDVTEAHLLRLQLAKRATTDVLTGLANRAGLEDAAERLGAITRGSTERLSVLYLDLDGMKEVNDSLGHPAGDQLLRTVADRIAGTLRSSDTVARLGGDEFVVLAAGIDEDTAASTLAVKIAQAVTRPVHLDGQVIVPTISIGIAVGDLATPFDVLLKKADDQLLARKRDLYGDTGHRRA